jgi:hypothetical protein
MTWPQILARHLNIPLYNLGRSGAGNSYMFNQLMQVDAEYEITPDDLVVICWTNVCREDRYAHGEWHVTGNLFSSNVYHPDWVKQWGDPEGFALRDYALIKGADEFLQSVGCSHQHLSMCNIVDRWDQWSDDPQGVSGRAVKMFGNTLDKILPSFLDVLWQNDYNVKRKHDSEIFGMKNIDRHPSPIEHLKYLQAVSGIEFESELIQAVENSQENFVNYFLNNDVESIDVQHNTVLDDTTRIWPNQDIVTI